MPDLRRAITALEPGTAFSFLDTMETLLARSIVEDRIRAQLASGFGVLALLLATILAATSAVLLAATAAAIGPAIRASRIDPLRALRE